LKRDKPPKAYDSIKIGNSQFEDIYDSTLQIPSD